MTQEEALKKIRHAKRNAIIELATQKAMNGEFVHSAMLTNAIGEKPVWSDWNMKPKEKAG